MNPIKELERQLEDANKALEESLEENSKEKTKLENAILVLEKKIAPFSTATADAGPPKPTWTKQNGSATTKIKK